MPEQEHDSAAPTRFLTRSIPRHVFMQVRCLHCGKIFAQESAAFTTTDAVDFRKTLFEHTAETGHKTEVTITESFWTDTVR